MVEIFEMEMVKKEDSFIEETKDSDVIDLGDSVEVVEKQKSYSDFFGQYKESIKGIPGAEVVEFGTKVSRFPIEKMKFVKSQKSRIALLTKKAVRLNTHYHEDTGSFFCFSGKCCDLLGIPSLRLCYPIVEYDTDRKGKILSESCDLKILVVGDGKYQDLQTIGELIDNEDLSLIDLLVTCKEDQYQDISFTQAGRVSWVRSKKIANYIMSYYKDNEKHMFRSVGRKLLEKDFLDMIGYTEDEILSGEDLDFESILDIDDDQA